ncbi:MAG: hypothetical protein JXB26_04255 [Candidatus Aminicenantes bacterium]|nr:hypothetical protein [Candidatus Aminicenantes bacterium]
MTHHPVEEWELDRYLLEELPPKRQDEVRKLIDRQPELQKKISRLEKSNDAFIKKHPPERLVPAIEARASKLSEERTAHSRRQRRKVYLIAVPAFTAALAFFAVVYFPQNRHTLSFTRTKGNIPIDTSIPQIIIYRKNGEGAEMLQQGDEASKGDLLQITYVPAGYQYGVILSLDGNGIVTLHHPGVPAGSTRLFSGAKAPLSSAYELDSAPEFERFVFVFSHSPIDTGKVLESARAIAKNTKAAAGRKLSLPPDWHQYSILIKKEKAE